MENTGLHQILPPIAFKSGSKKILIGLAQEVITDNGLVTGAFWTAG